MDYILGLHVYQYCIFTEIVEVKESLVFITSKPFLLSKRRIMTKIGVKSGLFIVIRRIEIHHIIGFSKSVRSVLCAAVCIGSV